MANSTEYTSPYFAGTVSKHVSSAHILLQRTFLPFPFILYLSNIANQKNKIKDENNHPTRDYIWGPGARGHIYRGGKRGLELCEEEKGEEESGGRSYEGCVGVDMHVDGWLGWERGRIFWG